MEINKGAKVGIMIQIVALMTMILLVIFNKIIPSVLMWVFSVGLVIALTGSLITLSKKYIQ